MLPLAAPGHDRPEYLNTAPPRSKMNLIAEQRGGQNLPAISKVEHRDAPTAPQPIADAGIGRCARSPTSSLRMPTTHPLTETTPRDARAARSVCRQTRPARETRQTLCTHIDRRLEATLRAVA